MTTTNSGPVKEDQGVVHCTVSSRAGRLLFALLLSSHDHSGLANQERSDTVSQLSKLANIPTKQLPACIDEISVVELVTVQEQSPGLENVVDAAGTQPASISIAHKQQEKLPILNSSQNYLPVEPSELVEDECEAADKAGDIRAQALAVVHAWEFFFPNLTHAKEITKRQGLRKEKAREWISIVSATFPGHEATTVFGWLGGVDEGKLLSMQFPLAYVNKMIVNKANEAKPRQEAQDDGGGVPDEWRGYARKLIEKGVNHNGNKDRTASLERIARGVGGSTG